MDYKIVKRFYSSIQANIYLLRMKEAGINSFLSCENISTILPLADGGFILNVAEDQIDEAVSLIKLIEEEVKEEDKSEDFREADEDDIQYAKQVNEHKKWLESGWIDMNSVSTILFLIFVLVVLGIVVNYFFPFS